MSSSLIRNFCIIAHVDHGKSTLADSLLRATNTLEERKAKAQFLDNMELERERGITIKAQTVRLSYISKDQKTYQLNLIDTPGHVDFSYEVSRALAACEGAILVIDAAQGVEAQTLANVYLALEHNLELILVLNKIDLPSSDPEKVKKEVKEALGLDTKSAILASAKENTGIENILEALVEKIPPPQGKRNASLKALVFDSWFDSYQGVVVLIRVVEGEIAVTQKITFLSSQNSYEVLELGVFNPFARELKQLKTGEVGFLICGVKDIREITVGDTITSHQKPAVTPLKGFQKVKPMVFSGIFPIDTSEFGSLKEALEKLSLNDPSLTYEPESSQALGFGMRCGFLGLLHMEVIKERLEREFNLDLICTAPSVIYKISKTNGEVLEIENPSQMPDASQIADIKEPMVKVSIYTPSDYIGSILNLCEERRGVQIKIDYLSTDRVVIEYKLPLNEIVLNFYDRLKSLSKGYASMDYELSGYEASLLVKIDILLAGDPVDALSIIVHRQKAEYRGRLLVKKLKTLLKRHQFQIAIQAAIGAQVIARETLGAYRKDVTAKLYGGDVTRKRKLLEKQKAGKKKMKQIGAVEIPQEAFLAILKVED